jgi:hypothetical protein
MGSLTADQIGAGAAVNNTTREFGGTLGVAVVGSVFSSLFAPAVAKAFAGFGLSSAQVNEASSSMQAALATTAHLPAEARPGVIAQINEAFMTGFHRGCFVIAGVMVALAVAALVYLPGRTHSDDRTSVLEAMAH